MTYTYLAERLRYLRIKNKMTQKDVAKFLEITESGYGYYEQGRNEPSLTVLRKLASKYGISVSYLIGETDQHRLEFTEDDYLNDIKILIKSLPESKQETAKQMILDYINGFVDGINLNKN